MILLLIPLAFTEQNDLDFINDIGLRLIDFKVLVALVVSKLSDCLLDDNVLLTLSNDGIANNEENIILLIKLI